MRIGGLLVLCWEALRIVRTDCWASASAVVVFLSDSGVIPDHLVYKKSLRRDRTIET